MTTKLHTYTVEGSGRFPVDMLRYDRAWPVTQTDAAVIIHEGERQVTLEGLGEPTNDRWSSFGWTVGEVTSRKL